jgi:hypothetical protein
VSSWSVAPGPYRLDDYVNGSLQSLQHTWIALCVAAAHTDHFDDYVINSVAASVHYVNGINNYFIIVKATTEAARIPFVIRTALFVISSRQLSVNSYFLS